MFQIKFFVAITFGFLIIVSPVHNAYAELKKYENTEYHFTVGYPSEWFDLSSQLIDDSSINSDVKYRELAIFQKNNVNRNSIPYMQIMAYDILDTNISWNEFLELMNVTIIEMASEYKSFNYIKEYNQISSASSKKDNYFVSNSEYKLIDNSWLHDISIYYLGKNISIQINILLPKSGWNDFIGTYNEIIKSFMFDDNYKFIDSKSGILEPNYTMNIQNKEYKKTNDNRLTTPIIIIALCVLLAIIRKNLEKEKEKETNNISEEINLENEKNGGNLS
jgi:hypothetical protein